MLSSAQDHLVQFIRITLKQCPQNAIVAHCFSIGIIVSSVMTPSSIDLGDMADYDEDDHSVRGATVSHETGTPEIPCFYREVCMLLAPLNGTH